MRIMEQRHRRRRFSTAFNHECFALPGRQVKLSIGNWTIFSGTAPRPVAALRALSG